jgi:Cof subfamily protein (haloacid dehalogenase superfamily)
MIRLICIDVDGTLVGTSGTVAPDTWAAAERMRDRGVRLAICSGRPAFGHTRGFAERLDPTGWHVFQNGASVVDIGRGETRSRPIPPDRLAWLLARAEATDRVLEFYTDHGYGVARDTEVSRRHAGLLGIPFALRDLATMPGPIVRAQWLHPLADVDALLAEPHEGLTYSASTSPMMPDTGFVNITPAGVDKAHAVRIVAREYGLSLDEVMMVGDGANDVTTLQAVGASVAMGNAEPEALAVARHRVGHVDHGGLVEAFELALALA